MSKNMYAVYDSFINKHSKAGNNKMTISQENKLWCKSMQLNTAQQ